MKSGERRVVLQCCRRPTRSRITDFVSRLIKRGKIGVIGTELRIFNLIQNFVITVICNFSFTVVATEIKSGESGVVLQCCRQPTRSWSTDVVVTENKSGESGVVLQCCRQPT